jgi:hypothetical protein
MDQLNVSNYDLTCLGISACPPEDFQALIQLLITKICEINNITPTEGKSAGCPDCVVSVAPCFVEGTTTTMQLVDYVQMIANRICSILDQIDIINNQITDLDVRVTVLENTPSPTFTLPSIPANCILASGTYPIDQVLNALMNNATLGYCSLLEATGTPAEITTATLSQCITDIDQPLAALPTVDTFSAYYSGSWVPSATLSTSPTAANAINNIWIAICDIYNYLSNGFPETVVDAGEGITVTSATVGNTTTYTVTNDYLETFVAGLTIKNTYAPDSGIIPKVLPSSVNGVQEGQVISKYTSVSANSAIVTATLGPGNYVTNTCLPTISFGSFDNDTGLFTITDPGTYSISAMVHLKPDNGSTIFWSGETTYSVPPTVDELADNFKALGSFLIGIHPNNNTDTFVAQGQALIPSIDRNVEVSVSKVITVTSTTSLRVKVLNTTNRDYDGTVYSGADSIFFSIVKLRNSLASSTCPSL